MSVNSYDDSYSFNNVPIQINRVLRPSFHIKLELGTLRIGHTSSVKRRKASTVFVLMLRFAGKRMSDMSGAIQGTVFRSVQPQGFRFWESTALSGRAQIWRQNTENRRLKTVFELSGSTFWENLDPCRKLTNESITLCWKFVIRTLKYSDTREQIFFCKRHLSDWRLMAAFKWGKRLETLKSDSIFSN